MGPGPDRWLTPEATEALASVDHVVGYAPYVNRVPQREGLQRHASGNTVEVDRARFALELAQAGERVAVVSGGDAGIFGMAAAVFEVADEFPDVEVHVVPGVSALQAVAAKAGAPIGADFAVVSLSDRLKPWSVIERRLHAIGEADLVLAVYNPASRSRVTQVAELQKILLEHRSPDTVVVVGRDVGRARGIPDGDDAGRARRRQHRHEVPVAHRGIIDESHVRRAGLDAADECEEENPHG